MRWHKPILYLWASPGSLLGLLPVPIALLQGGSARVVDGVLEVQGGIVTTILRRGLPWVNGAAAMTLGHVVWGCDQSCLDMTRAHERVHVTQYERWGPFFIPAYLLSSLLAWWRGLNPYLDNRFEVEAYGHGDCVDDHKC